MKQRHILILKSNDWELDLIGGFLKDNNFIKVTYCSSLKEVSLKFNTTNIDLCILNYHHDEINNLQPFIESQITIGNYAPAVLFLVDTVGYHQIKEMTFSFESGYLLKPLRKDELICAIELLLKRYYQTESQNTDLYNWTTSSTDSFVVKKNQIYHKLEWTNIYYVEVEGRYSKIVSDLGNYVLQYSLLEIKRLLPPKIFLRSHRKYLVNIIKVKEIHYHDNLIILNNKMTVSMGKSYKNDFINGYTILK